MCRKFGLVGQEGAGAEGASVSCDGREEERRGGMPRKGAHWEEEEEKCQKEGRRKVHLTGKYRRTRGREGYLLLFSYSSSSSSRCLALAVCWQNLHREGQRGKRGRGLLLRLCVRLTHTHSLRPCSGPTPHLWRYCSPFPLLLFPGWHRREKRIPFLPCSPPSPDRSSPSSSSCFFLRPLY